MTAIRSHTNATSVWFQRLRAPAIPSQYHRAKDPTTEETPRAKSLLPFLRALSLNKLSFDTGVGEVNLDALTAADAEFDTGIGDLYVTDCSFATCDVDGGTGNLSFENCAFDEMDIDGGTGNITVTSSQSLTAT